jgi:circadian clock protein KaiB
VSEVGNNERKGANPGSGAKYVLRVYVAGDSLRSRRIIELLSEFRGGQPADDVDMEIIDIYQQQDRARREGIMVAPMLVRERPLPRRRYVGQSVDAESIRQILQLDSAGEQDQ